MREFQWQPQVRGVQPQPEDALESLGVADEGAPLPVWAANVEN